jgi:transketolase
MNSIEFAKKIRLKVLDLVFAANASHIGGAYSMADILAVLYTNILNINPELPEDPERDRFFLSKGHTCAGLYATLGIKGFFNLDDLKTYAQNGSKFLSHTSHHIEGVEVSSGSLGHVLSIACGVAYGLKLKKEKPKVYCLISDGELNEGSNWEPILFAPHHKLDNLVLIVDYNKIQSFGNVKDVIELEPLKQKFEAFRWNVIEINGHDHVEITKAFLKFNNVDNLLPTVIIANTVKGKGVDFMENKLLWHYKSPDEAQYLKAKSQLENFN